MPVNDVILPCGTQVGFYFQREVILPSRVFFSHDSARWRWIIKFSNVTPLMRNSPRIGATILKRKIEAELNTSLSANIVSLHLCIVNNQLEFRVGLELMDDVLCRLTTDSATSFCKTIGKLLEAEYVTFQAQYDVLNSSQSPLETLLPDLTPQNSPTSSL